MTWPQQSPINLQPTVEATAPRNYLRLAWSQAVDGFRHGGAHGVEVLFGTRDTNYLELEGKRFHLRQFHFHHPSEHLLEANAFDGELHVVHQNLEDLSLAVIGIFLKVDLRLEDDQESADTAAAFTRLHETCSQVPLPPPVWWLPGNRDRILRYEGSLTTEPFTESVSWIVLPEPRVIGVNLFTKIFGSHPQSARGIQALNRRFILDLKVKIAIE